MAKTTVKAGQGWSAVSKKTNIPEEDLRAANPGVKTLKTGQVLNTPKFPSGQGVMRGTNKGTTFDESGKGGNVNPMPAPVQRNPFTGNAIQAGTQVSYPQMPTINTPFGTFGQQPVQSQPNVYIPSSRNLNVNYVVPPVNMTTRVNPVPLTGQQSQQPLTGQQSQYPPLTGQQSQQPQPYTGTAGYYAVYNQQQKQQPYLGSSNYLDPRYQQAQAAQPKSALPQRPATQYTGDPNDPNTQAWINYWNASATLAAANPAAYNAELGIDPNKPRVMSREEIRRMKQEQRRRQEANMEGDGASNFDGGNYANQPNNPYYYPELRRNIVWGA